MTRQEFERYKEEIGEWEVKEDEYEGLERQGKKKKEELCRGKRL